MMIVMKPTATEDEVQAVIARIESCGAKAHPSRGEEVILIAKDLTPSQTASLDTTKIAGFVTDAGGKTSHTAIIARAHEIPAVVGLETITELVETDDLILITLADDRHRTISRQVIDGSVLHSSLEQSPLAEDSGRNVRVKVAGRDVPSGKVVQAFPDAELNGTADRRGARVQPRVQVP